jgi:hypothetical protein
MKMRRTGWTVLFAVALILSTCSNAHASAIDMDDATTASAGALHCNLSIPAGRGTTFELSIPAPVLSENENKSYSSVEQKQPL